MDKLILFFKAKSFFHLFIIFIIFGISGSLSVFISGPLINYLNIKTKNLITNNIFIVLRNP